MKILVLGTSGQVGSETMLADWGPDTVLIGLARPDIDMAQPGTIDAAMAAHAPDLVVNATAYTAVDKAESERETAFAVNRDGPARLAALCAEHGAALVLVTHNPQHAAKCDRQLRLHDGILREVQGS